MSHQAQNEGAEPVKFAVVCPAWECSRWAERCLRSIMSQTYTNFECIYIDAFSSDSTFDIASAVVGSDSRFTVVRNTERKFPLENIVFGTNQIAKNDNDVILIVDGDDWLAHDRVFEILAQIYSDPNVWLSYGNHAPLRRTLKEKLRGRKKKGTYEYPDYVYKYAFYRQFPFFCPGHVRAYRKFLFDSIRDADLRDDDGGYFWGGGDAATMYPMLEMATKEHVRYVDDVLYIYNNDHGLSEMRPETREAKNIVKMKIQSLPKYEPLERTL